MKKIYSQQKPYIFNLKKEAEIRLLKKVKKDSNTIHIDTFQQQLKDLMEVPLLRKVFLNKDAEQWIYFPWKKTLAKFLSKKWYLKVKASRNLYILSPKEQKKYFDLKIAIAGLSVGSSIAANFVLENGSGLIKIADNDIINLSNLNRIRTSSLNIGRSKVVLLAEELFEINPYISISSFPNGITTRNVDVFINKPKVDLVIEETDDLEVKVMLRKAAKKYGVPLIMATGVDSKLIIDYEDYRVRGMKAFLGLLTKREIQDLTSANIQRKATGAIKIVGKENFSERVNFTFKELNKSVNAFPQLGSSAFLRASVITTLVRLIFIHEQDIKSGRYIFDVKDVFKKRK